MHQVVPVVRTVDDNVLPQVHDGTFPAFEDIFSSLQDDDMAVVASTLRLILGSCTLISTLADCGNVVMAVLMTMYARNEHANVKEVGELVLQKIAEETKYGALVSGMATFDDVPAEHTRFFAFANPYLAAIGIIAERAIQANEVMRKIESGTK
jgi:predicted membrane protein